MSDVRERISNSIVDFAARTGATGSHLLCGLGVLTHFWTGKSVYVSVVEGADKGCGGGAA